MLGMYFVQQLLSVASWFVIGRGIFQGHFDMGWLLAWAILLLSTIPVQIIVSDAQSELSMGAGAFFKQRLIQGTLKLDPEEIRHQGMGQFLNRVMESEAVEMLALSGGFTALLSFIELGLAFVILLQRRKREPERSQPGGLGDDHPLPAVALLPDQPGMDRRLPGDDQSPGGRDGRSPHPPDPGGSRATGTRTRTRSWIAI